MYGGGDRHLASGARAVRQLIEPSVSDRPDASLRASPRRRSATIANHGRVSQSLLFGSGHPGIWRPRYKKQFLQAKAAPTLLLMLMCADLAVAYVSSCNPRPAAYAAQLQTTVRGKQLAAQNENGGGSGKQVGWADSSLITLPLTSSACGIKTGKASKSSPDTVAQTGHVPRRKI